MKARIATPPPLLPFVWEALEIAGTTGAGSSCLPCFDVGLMHLAGQPGAVHIAPMRQGGTWREQRRLVSWPNKPDGYLYIGSAEDGGSAMDCPSDEEDLKDLRVMLPRWDDVPTFIARLCGPLQLAPIMLRRPAEVYGRKGRPEFGALR